MSAQPHERSDPSAAVFAMRYSRWLRPLLSIIGMGPKWPRVELASGTVRVRMGWGFHGDIARSRIAGAGRQPDWRWAIGVHTNLKGSWLANGSPSGIVALSLMPAARGRVMGFGVKVRRLGIALEEPEGFLRGLGAPALPPA